MHSTVFKAHFQISPLSPLHHYFSLSLLDYSSQYTNICKYYQSLKKKPSLYIFLSTHALFLWFIKICLLSSGCYFLFCPQLKLISVFLHHCIKIVFIKVSKDLYFAKANSYFCLILFDISASFDMVDHNLLLEICYFGFLRHFIFLCG